MAIKGSLQDVGLADICQLLAMGRKTGCLSITDRSNFGYIYFEKGRVIYASLLNRPDRLGELLLRNGIVSGEQLDVAMVVQDERRGGSMLGEILLEHGDLAEEDLHRFVRVQIEEAVYHLFTWNRGAFHFDPDQRPDEEGYHLVDIPAENLLLEGARRVDEWSQIEKKVSSFDLVFEVVSAPEDSEDVELEPRQERILPLIDGERTVADIVSASGLVEFEVGKALYGLVQAGFVERVGQRVTDAPDLDDQLREHLNLGVAFYRSGMFEDAMREFDSVLEGDPKNTAALHRRGLIAFRSHRYDEALDYFDRIQPLNGDAFAVECNRALTLEMLGRFDDALSALDRCDHIRPRTGSVALSRGILLLQAGAPVEALHEFGVYRDDPDVNTPSAPYYAAAVLAAGMTGDLHRAIALGREGLALHPRCGPLLVNTAGVLDERGDRETAQALYRRAVALTPAPAQAHKALGDHALEADDRDAARAHYERAVKIDPRLGDDVYLRLGTLALDEQDTDLARLSWRRALEINPENAEVRALLGQVEGAD
ncbi:MAG: DUF4388 domain-containing protein [Gemmatimonadetes bacterium]|nr:DUF4388 domain-containing protein [Gemmatimonadota bacterium]